MWRELDGIDISVPRSVTAVNNDNGDADNVGFRPKKVNKVSACSNVSAAVSQNRSRVQQEAGEEDPRATLVASPGPS